MDEPVRIFSTVSRVNGSGGTCLRTRHWRWDLIHTWLRSHQLLAFFLIAFIAAWMVWLRMIAAARGLIGARFPPFFLWIAGIAPIGAATLVEWIVSGKQGVRRLYSRTHIQGVPAASLAGSVIALAVILIFGSTHLSRMQARQVIL